MYSGQTNNNTVNLFKSTTVDYLFGGMGTSSNGNTLNIYGYGNTVKEKLDGFQNINFIFDKSAVNQTMLSVIGENNISGAYIQAGITDADLKSNQKITLLDSKTDVSGAVIPEGEAVVTPTNLGGYTNLYEYRGKCR